MKKIIILDLRGDKQGIGMRKMLNDGAFPEPLKQTIESIMGDVYPFEENENTQDLCPGIGFPGHSPIHAIMNHLYATAQRPHIPEDIMSTVRDEAKQVMNISGDFDDDTKKMVLQGSKKTYNRVLDDGTEIKVEITSPTKKESSADPMEKLRSMTSKRKEAAVKVAGDKFRLDVHKLFKTAGHLHIADADFGNKMQELARKTADSGRILLTMKECESDKLLSGCISKIAELAGTDTGEVIDKAKADKNSDKKMMFHGEVVDKRKLSCKPFDSYSNAVKALGKQVAELICDKVTGNVKPELLKNLEMFAGEDALMSKLADKVAHVLKWTE